MKNLLGTGVITALLTGMVMTVSAQTVSIPIGQQGQELRGQQAPVRGMPRENVETRFGAPILKSNPVGQPPISFWEYDNYFVYFEHDRVLHTVMKHRR